MVNFLLLSSVNAAQRAAAGLIALVIAQPPFCAALAFSAHPQPPAAAMQRGLAHTSNPERGLFPGLEPENLGAPCNQRPSQTPSNSPLAGRQEKPGAPLVGSAAAAARTDQHCLPCSRLPLPPKRTGAYRQPLAALPRGGNGLFGCSSGGKASTPFGSPVAASAFTDASGEPTFSGLAAPADSCDPTVDGPAPKRPRTSYGLRAGGWGYGGSAAWGSAASCDTDDSDGEDAVVSCKRPTPQKVPAPAVAAAAPRPPALHPPPTWAAAMQSGMQSRGGGRRQQQQQRRVHWGAVSEVGAAF